MVLMRYWRTEQREDAVAGRLHDVAVVATNGVDHQRQRGINDRARLLRVEALHQLSRTLDVGKQGGDSFAFTFRNGLRFTWNRDRYALIGWRRIGTSCRCGG